MLVFHNHRFEPARIQVPANMKFQLHVKNTDSTADEFESVDLNREKLVTPGQTITVFLGPLSPGEYNSSATSIRIPPRACWWRNDPVAVGTDCGAGVLAPPREVRADYHLVSPYEIDLGELEIEHNCDAVFDRRPDQRQQHELHAGTWHRPDRRGGTARSNLASTVHPASPAHPADAGGDGKHVPVDRAGRGFPRYRLLLRIWPIDDARRRYATSNEVTFGPVFGKDIGRTTHREPVPHKAVGPDQTSQGLDFSYAWQSRWNLWAPMSPGDRDLRRHRTLGSTPGFPSSNFSPARLGRFA